MNDGADTMEAPLERISRLGRLLMLAMTAVFVVVLLRVAQLQAFPGDRLAAHVEDRIASRSEFAPRGDLLDRRGRLLAGTRVGRRVFVDPTRFPAPYDEHIVALAGAVGIDPDIVGTRILSRIAENERRRAEQRRLIQYVSIGPILSDAGAEHVRSLGIPGVHLERRSVRETPGEKLAATIVGKVGVDHDGLLGAERTLDSQMQARDGRLDYVHDARGRALWIEAGGYAAPKRGESVRLSVDLGLQQIAQEELMRGVVEADAAGGRLIMLDPMTGEVLAMVDLTRELSGLVKPGTEEAAEARRDNRRVRFDVMAPDPGRLVHPAMGRNRCVEDVYEPGSTFKAFMWATVTELELARPEEEINTEGGRWRTSYGRRIEDVVRRDKQTWADVLVNSSNIGMIKVCERLTPQQMQHAVRRFGFGARTGIDLPGEAVGLVTSPRNWNKFTHTSVSFGYEIAVTPIQMVRAFSAFARTGEMAGTLPNVRLTAPGPEERTELVHRVLPAWTANLTRETMRGVGANLDRRLMADNALDADPAYPLFGKSGTAKIPRSDGRGYFDQYFSSFIAGAPVRSPRIVVLVVIDDPGPALVRARRHYGSATAGPVVRRVVDRSLAYLGVAPEIVEPSGGTP
ncbi:MAG: penicillin-binding protein 2 [Phycisphaeraceae bacterium]|nr:MAG: penicillin-binding protein 2 [Phycisphaeraceae bacterium]